MKVEPAAAGLLEIARATLLAEIAPSLSAQQRYAALMVANAMAVAARDLASPGQDADEIARIVALLGDWTPQAGDALREGTARLAARIREGRFDEPPAKALLLEHLRTTTRARLAVSNPRALARQPGKAT